ncbi:unnamed protein product [Mytilus edulis]|uniref:Reverse transcriptase zinc-binding domain-containing protein n=1 Tax=Mytilus edulis TaxID=6550 RepID=A0A8S3R1J9_MYTED|nr:unnamed protein product [Mytilus edulis]
MALLEGNILIANQQMRNSEQANHMFNQQPNNQANHNGCQSQCQYQHLSNNMRALEQQMSQHMCITTALTTQLAIQLQQSISSTRNQIPPVNINMVPQPAPYIQGQPHLYHQYPMYNHASQPTMQAGLFNQYHVPQATNFAFHPSQGITNLNAAHHNQYIHQRSHGHPSRNHVRPTQASYQNQNRQANGQIPPPPTYHQANLQRSSHYHQNRNNNQTMMTQHTNANAKASSNTLEKQQANTTHVLYADNSTKVVAQVPTIICSDGQNKMVHRNNVKTHHIPVSQPTTESKHSEVTITENFQVSASLVQSEVAPLPGETIKESNQIEDRTNRTLFRNSEPQEQTTRHPQNGHGNRNTQQSRQRLNIVTCNIEGVKGNAAYLSDLSKEQDIICLQEHWLWSFELQKLDEKLADYKIFGRSHDCNEPITNYQIPRGRAGVAIAWPQKFDKVISKLDDGNERIIAIEIIIYCQDPVNTSTHVPVKACTNVYLEIKKNSKSKANSVAYKLIWEEMDKDIYINEIDKHLQYLPSDETTVDDKIKCVMGILHKATKLAVPSRIIKLNGPKRKASPDVKRLIGISKNKHRLWNDAGRPRDDHPLFKDKKEAKRNLRKQQRKETALEKEQFIQKLEENPNDQIFHQLIRRNRSETSKSDTNFLKMGEEEAISKKEQCELLAKYFEDLAQPKDNVNFNNEKLLNSHRHRFNQAEVDPICPNCRTENEDLCHVLTTCPLYMNIRIALYTPIKNFIVSIISESTWATHFSNREAICTLIVDCQSFANLNIIPNNPEILGKIENMSRIYCYEIHKKRLSAEI